MKKIEIFNQNLSSWYLVIDFEACVFWTIHVMEEFFIIMFTKLCIYPVTCLSICLSIHLDEIVSRLWLLYSHLDPDNIYYNTIMFMT